MATKKTAMKYEEAERIAIGSPIFVRVVGGLIAFILLGGLGWVGSTLNELSKSNVKIETQITQINTSMAANQTKIDTDYNNMNERVRQIENKMAGQGGPGDPWYLIITNMQQQLNNVNSGVAGLSSDVKRLNETIEIYTKTKK